ncbi:MAG: OmpA family protein, partial [Gammaproteobacteria bacterium]
MRRWSLILAFLLPLFAPGHAAAAATWFEDKQSCIIAGAVGGAAVGALADSVTVGGGTVVGAILGALLCRPADADGDGVPDRRDKCPDTPQGVAVDPEGCPLDSDG